MAKLALLFASVSGALAVGLGAFGAHALKAFLAGRGSTATWETAVFYQLVEAVALFALALHADASGTPMSAWAMRLWMLGPVLFSGSLYGLAVGGPGWLGPITPLGGLALIAGWLALAVAAFRL